MSSSISLRLSVIAPDVSSSFGAVLEEFELNDALENVFSLKDPAPVMDYSMVEQQQVMAY